MANILHILNGDAPRPAMEQSSVPGTLSAWPDVLHDGPTPLATGDEWIVLAEGPRTPEQAFVASARLEEAIYMGDSSFWVAVTRLSGGPHPLIARDVQDRPGRLPDGTLRLTDTGRVVLAGRADHLALNGISRWLGGTLLTPERPWRWTGSSLRPPAP